VREGNGDGLPMVFTSRCAGCGASIAWVETVGGKWMPVDENLGPHFATCAFARRFSRRFRQPRTAKEQLAFLVRPPSDSS